MRAIWFVYSILCAFFLSLMDVATKKLSSSIGEFEIALGRIGFAVPVLWLFALFEGIPPVNGKIIGVYLFSLPLEAAATLLYIRALSLSPLSLTVPFLSFTPVFLLATSPVMMGERAGPAGVIGVMLIALGAYALNLGSIRQGSFAPLRALIRERGSLLMLAVALIYSVTANFGKMGVLYSSPSFFAATYFSLLALALLVVVLLKKGRVGVFRREMLPLGLLSGVMITFHMLAIELINVSYMIAVKRSSLLFGILFGALVFREKGLRERLPAGVLMMIGILFLAVFG